MSKIQIFQLIGILALAIYVVISYGNEGRIEWLFYTIVVINIVLWVLRQMERKIEKQKNDAEK
ncbi:hypothetical protein [Bacillus solitudinis]|uniref:hypothetical protein n=1 Tax=Bacillus solitudinis TaxID=2014074 RepID=UPI000C231E74|nr:hypothetical protein [Bacillus solitudinis]